MNVSLIFLLCISAVNGVSDIKILDNEYKFLPPIFHIDNYDDCLQENKNFCKLFVKLLPLNGENSTTWKIIEKMKKNKRFYDHDQLFHGICFDNSNTTSTLLELASNFYSSRYKDVGLKAEIKTIHCRTQTSDDELYQIKIFDILVLLGLIVYLVIIITATLYDFYPLQSSSVCKIINLFSPRSNLEKFIQTYDSDQKLKCIQGIRFYTTFLIVFCHTFCSFIGGYVSDTKYFEDFPQNSLKHGLMILFVFLVQPFFLLSAWLLSYHTFQIFEQNKNLSNFKYFFLTFINRYIRIIPPLLFFILLGRSVWVYRYFHGPVKDIYSDKEYLRCCNNWWTNLLFINNVYHREHMCYFITWYLAADTQLYVLSLIILIIMRKFQSQLKLIMGLCIAIGIIIPSILTYIYNLDIIYRITPAQSKFSIFQSFDFFVTYSATFTNMATYMLGLTLGYVYYKCENRIFFKNKKFLWWILFLGPLISVFILSSYEYGKIGSAILGGILKPLFALGIGIGILGMSQNIGGVAQKICEWKPALFLGNISYSTYVAQFVPVFSRTALATEPFRISDYILFSSFIQDVIASFICGFLVHLLIEMPASTLQRKFVPKLKTKAKVAPINQKVK